MSITLNIDEEWENFISTKNYDDDDEYNENDPDDNSDNDEVTKILKQESDEYLSANLTADITSEAPKATNIYISTRTKIAYLNTPIHLASVFWDIPVMNYYKPKNGVIKKQMKFNSTSQLEVDFIQKKLNNEYYFEENVITHIDNPAGRIKYKDIRKVSIGISRKDIMSYRCKKRSAFYNCFVIILRMKIDKMFKEFHVKVFNTGKLEIPGIQNENTFQLILSEVIKTLQPYMIDKLYYKPDTEMTVLINSNFNCGFFINRETLYDILKFKYNIQAIYDPCSYPGIQCKFYYNPDTDIQNGCQISEENKHLYKNIKQVSFMIFRTGSVLIVGKCDENVLIIIYEFLKIILNNEFKNINQKITASELSYVQVKDKSKKVRRKTIIIDASS
jgi:TATA-box binding protein (TBP) (component of TFIID and TFIIIB)